ncbi:MAG: ABC transporter substrate-binding protein, partial [Rubrivivax sp.]
MTLTRFPGRLALLTAALTIATAAVPVHAAEKIRFGLSWLAQAEHCGFFQAKAQGLY